MKLEWTWEYDHNERLPYLNDHFDLWAHSTGVKEWCAYCLGAISAQFGLPRPHLVHSDEP